MTFLPHTTQKDVPDIGAALRQVMSQGGPGPWRQMWEILLLTLSGRGLGIGDYYGLALWRRPGGAALRRDLMSAASADRDNRRLRMPGHGPGDSALNDKLATEAILLARGLPVVRTRAAYAPPGSAPPVPSHVRALPDRAALAAFLADPGGLPVFGKPREDRSCRGAAAICAVSPDGQALRFLDGRTVPVAALADEIAAGWPGGYLFQTCHAPHPALLRHTGPATASLRITTLLTDRGVEPWYAVVHLPGPGDMHIGEATVWGLVDLASGEVVVLRDIRSPAGPVLRHGLDPGEPLLGLRLPDWDAALAAVEAAHKGFGGHGIVGWDVLLTEDGPLLCEGNANPGPVFQNVALQGLRHPAMAGTYRRALAHARARRRRAPHPTLGEQPSAI